MSEQEHTKREEPPEGEGTEHRSEQAEGRDMPGEGDVPEEARPPEVGKGEAEAEAPVSVASDEVGPEPAPEPVEEPDPLEQAREESKRLREQMLRIAADFDNFRKRARRENDEAGRRAKIDVLRELLPVFDNMERAVAHAEQAADAKAVATGVSMVVRQFEDTIGKMGVERIKSVGEPFDPNVHEAIQQIESADHVAGTVVAELLAGYAWGERLLRAAMVVVSKAPAEAEPESPDGGDGVIAAGDGGESASETEQEAPARAEDPTSGSTEEEAGDR